MYNFKTSKFYVSLMTKLKLYTLIIFFHFFLLVKYKQLKCVLTIKIRTLIKDLTFKIPYSVPFIFHIMCYSDTEKLIFMEI